ncbi:LysR family transcriptional regulator [Acinetobacter calcoaceticus]|uniref:LysR family transcriptional regulator n=1 Tax=Acinetobacter calcoaceticus TaxID=471 RepID=A0A4R1XZG9_ACICA|nr:LysR family transcriptional regulator [Acinetobacter calcoaceticus]
MQVSLQALKAFEAAARLGSFKLAAEELTLTPTAISHHIRNLESRLNVNLFHRQVRKITLTEVGERLATTLSEGFRKIEDALDEIQIAARVLRVTTTSSLAAMVLIPALNEFAQIHSDISIEISTSERLESHLYTLPIRYGDALSIAPSDMIKRDSFNVFAATTMDLSAWPSQPVALFITEWKNKALPEPPLDPWLVANGLDRSNFVIKKFDQEIFGIQQALSANGLVFCSHTLIDKFVVAKLMQQVGTRSIESNLCYYIPKKEGFTNKNIRAFIQWIEMTI